MRVQVEEIDGRDGDLITDLGFKAYDKTFEIGLKKSGNADEVAGFFNSEGTVTFSNEPDKYYNYKIVKQIDMEKLLSFKKANITMHVQPYKYSVNEKEVRFQAPKNLLNIPAYVLNKSGVTVTVSNGEINVYGESNDQITFLIPIDNLRLEPNLYNLWAYVLGSGSVDCKFSVINNVPTTGTCFGTGPIDLLDNELASTSASYLKPKNFNYIYLNIPENKVVNFSIYSKIFVPGEPLGILNLGNTKAAPILTIEGTGDITLSLNSKNVFDVALGTEEYITIDTLEMEARKGDVLKNRLVSGSYDEFRLKPGLNTISYTGIVESISIKKYSRWL